MTMPGLSGPRRRVLRRGIVALILSAVSLLTLALVSLGWRLPSVRSLAAYTPARETTLPAQLWTSGPLIVEPIAVTSAFTPALIAAEGKANGGGNFSVQIARTMPSAEETVRLRRSLEEVLLAVEINVAYSPEERMTIYLNRATFGAPQPGLAAASTFYLRKSPDRLSLAERALLVGLLRNPAHLSPFRNSDRALARRNQVLQKMQQQGSITVAQCAEAQATPLLDVQEPN
jgi:membrane carboxypeptidase/penicillin-binding protein